MTIDIDAEEAQFLLELVIWVQRAPADDRDEQLSKSLRGKLEAVK